MRPIPARLFGGEADGWASCRESDFLRAFRTRNLALFLTRGGFLQILRIGRKSC